MLCCAVEGTPWREQSPYRNKDTASTNYLNQFPNTWQAAEALAQQRSTQRSSLDKKVVDKNEIEKNDEEWRLP